MTDAVLGHSNSFTGARRFLLPQVLIAHFARRRGLREVRFLDLGTGLGVLPRQLNHRTCSTVSRPICPGPAVLPAIWRSR